MLLFPKIRGLEHRTKKSNFWKPQGEVHRCALTTFGQHKAHANDFDSLIYLGRNIFGLFGYVQRETAPKRFPYAALIFICSVLL